MGTSEARALREAHAEGRAMAHADDNLRLAAALSFALDGAQLQPGCARCVAREKAAGAVEPMVRAAVTWQDGEPVCYEHYQVIPQLPRLPEPLAKG